MKGPVMAIYARTGSEWMSGREITGVDKGPAVIDVNYDPKWFFYVKGRVRGSDKFVDLLRYIRSTIRSMTLQSEHLSFNT